MDYAIPIGVVLVFAGMFYAQPKIKAGVDAIFGAIKNFFIKIWEELSGTADNVVEYQTTYKYE